MSEKQKRGPYLKKGSRDYINNKEFTEKLKQYARTFNGKKAELAVLPENEGISKKELKKITTQAVEMPESLAKDIMTLGRRYATKWMFSRFPYKDELEAEAVITMFRGASNFDEKYDNGFAYMTQIAKSGIVNKIKSEDKELKGKDQLILNLGAEYLEDENVSESVLKLQEFAEEREKSREANKNVKSTFVIKNRNNHKK